MRQQADIELDADVVVVGSGAGGGPMAAILAEAGLDVVLLEEGGYHTTAEFTPDATAMMRMLYRDGGASATIGTPPVVFTEGRTVGGSTVINGGMSWRTPEKILERWQRDDGVDAISAREMEPTFERVEEMISARRQDPESIGRDNELLREGADRKQWRWLPNIRNQLHCAGSNNCAFGCPTGAKRSVLLTYVPRALAFGARLYSGVRVERVERRGHRVTGVSGRTEDGKRLRVRAARTVISCGAMQTPALLLRSGIRSPSGRLGHNLTLHPNIKVHALFDEPVEGWKGVHQAYQVREFQDDGIVFAAVNLPPALVATSAPRWGGGLMEMMRQYDRIVTAGALLEDTRSGRVRVAPGGRPVGFYQISELDAARAVRATALLCELLFAAGARKIYAPFDGVGDLDGPDDVRRLQAHPVPRSAIELFTVHVMGTAAMGGDPARHVCDSYGAVYGYDGLYVSDASLFPSPIGVNPMETILALATRNATHILQTPNNA